MDPTHYPAFSAYVVSAVVLCLTMLGLWFYSGVVRGGTRTVMNPEDATTVAKGAAMVTADPPAVARVLRAHQNAMANVVPFLILGLLDVLLGASRTAALLVFGTFTGARLVHAVTYVRGMQPWRSIAFIVGSLAMVALVVDLVRHLP